MSNTESFLRTYFHHILAYIASILIILGMLYSLCISAPVNFPDNTLVSIENGKTAQTTAILLKEKGIIRSAFILSKIIILLRGESGIQAGTYYFDTPESVYDVAVRLLRGDLGQVSVRVTIPEGLSRVDVAEILAENLPNFDVDVFLEITQDKEGYLFPDTYYFLPSSTADVVAQILEDTFYKKINSLQEDVQKSEKSIEDIIILASIVEAEASSTEDRQYVAGILWKRLKIGMPLQVDVTFRYLNGKTTADLTLEDLKNDSPYNTYVHKGLPPTPISNPSLDAILATLHPKESPYLFFLADSDGFVHYSQTFAEHKEKKALYIW